MSEKEPVTIEELEQIPILKGLPHEQLQWILEHSKYMEFQDGELILRFGEPVHEMWFILEGRVDHYVDVNGRQVHYITFGHEPPTNGVTGMLPYSRMTNAGGWSYAKGKLTGLVLDKSHFKELEDVSPELIQRLVSNMTERARWFATRKLQEEKISALGKLSAGLAHELNNPAAAIQRTVTDLSDRLQANYDLTSALLENKVQPDEVQRVYRLVLRQSAEAKGRKLTLMQRMELEDNLSERLESYGIPEPQTLAESMANAGIDLATLEEIHEDVSTETFRPLMRWLCNILVSTRVIKEIEEASSRISNLVTAMKAHVHMDRSVAMQPMDIHEGIDNSLTLLNHKIKKKNITVDKQYDEHLPEVSAYGGELNQVWSNLIDNAVDALEQDGHLTIVTKQEHDKVKVCVADDGIGIPESIRNQIFDPFFTTKKQGEGTGIGLDLVKQIISRHEGEIHVVSEPGKTEFQVLLPIHPQEEGQPDLKTP